MTGIASPLGSQGGVHPVPRCDGPWDDCWRFAICGHRLQVIAAFDRLWPQARVIPLNEPLGEEEVEELIFLANSALGPQQQAAIDRLHNSGQALAVRIEGGHRMKLERPLFRHSPLLVWHAHHPSGFGGMFISALGLIERAAEAHQPVLIVWSRPHLLYCGFNSGNVWEEFFQQPAVVTLGEERVSDLLAAGDVTELHATPCMLCPRVGLPAAHAERLRLLCQRFAFPRPEILQVAAEFAVRHLQGRWLAVHVRRSDKYIETPENLDLRDDQIIGKIMATCGVWQCVGCFVCSDDWELKLRVQHGVEACGLTFCSYGSLLGIDVAETTHMNRELDGHRKAWDTVFEVCLMAFFCQGLLCTHSFMANMVVFFSRPSYPYRTFWDPVDGTPSVGCLADLGSCVGMDVRDERASLLTIVNRNRCGNDNHDWVAVD